MGRYLNSRVPFDAYKATAASRYFVDKSALIAELIPSLGMDERFFCITRPRRFGKSVMANMVGAFFGKAADADAIFDKLEIASPEITKKLHALSCKDYSAHLNRYDVIYIDFSKAPEICSSYDGYITRISNGLKKDLMEAFSALNIDQDLALWDILTDIYLETGQRFIFVMDEWDAIFHMPFITDADKQGYLLFLRSLLKDNIYVELAYMTGILPIAYNRTSCGPQRSNDLFVNASGESLQAVFPADALYSDGSELNMFVEYNMATSERFSGYFGFSDQEVDRLYSIYQQTAETAKICRDDLRVWYDGYHTAGGKRLYNPRSVVCALTDGQLRDHWTSSGTYDSIFGYIKDNIADVQEDLPLLFAGEKIPADIHEYAATSMVLETKDEIYSAMVVYGLLTYEDGFVSIPNKELMDSYAAMMKKERSLGYIYSLANMSKRMLSATLTGDTQTMAQILKYAHDTESPIFSYNSEIELSAVVNLVYLAARDKYRVEREDKAGEGYVDFIFYPARLSADAIILELKIDSTPEDAIMQIKNKGYALRFKGKLGEKPKYTGRILAVGINCDKKTKEHSCKVEIL